MLKKQNRFLKNEEKNAVKLMVEQSAIKNKKQILDVIDNIQVVSLNDDDSILEFVYNGNRTNFSQNLVYPTAIVEDCNGKLAEVLIYTDNIERIVEFELVSMGDADLRYISWETFRLNNEDNN